MKILEDEDLVLASATKGADLLERLHRLDGHHAVREVRGLGLMIGIELVADMSGDTDGPGASPGAKVVAEALRRGVWVYPAGDGNVPDALLVGPPFTVTDVEMDRLVQVVSESISAVYGD